MRDVVPEWYRDRVQQKFGRPVGDWEREAGRKLEDGLYRGVLRRDKRHAGCGCATIYATSEAGRAGFHASKSGTGTTSGNLLTIDKKLN